MSHLKNELRLFSAADFSKFNFYSDEKEAALAQAEKLETLSKSGSDKGFCATVLRDSQVLFVGGYFEIRPGVAEVFIVPDSAGVRNFPKSFHRLVMKYIEWVLRKEWCKKLETASLDIPRINDWMTALKFSCDSYTNSGEYRKWSRWA